MPACWLVAAGEGAGAVERAEPLTQLPLGSKLPSLRIPLPTGEGLCELRALWNRPSAGHLGGVHRRLARTRASRRADRAGVAGDGERVVERDAGSGARDGVGRVDDLGGKQLEPLALQFEKSPGTGSKARIWRSTCTALTRKSSRASLLSIFAA